MTHVAQIMQAVEIIHRRKARRAAFTRSLPQRALHVGALALGGISVLLAFLAVAALPLYSYVVADLPDIEQLEVLLDPQTGLLLQPTTLFDRTGERELVALQPDSAGRVFVSSKNNQFLGDALVTRLDPQFFSREGITLPNLNQLPTLAEQLSARVLLAGEKDGWRKSLRAWILGAQTLKQYGDEQVLEWSFNSTTFGHWTFGAESAAQYYFGKSTSDLTLGQAATLAAAANTTELNPIDSSELALQFRDFVLTAMHEQGYISQQELFAALAEKITLLPPTSPSSQFSDFTNLAIQQAVSALGLGLLERGGLTVITTLDNDAQSLLADLPDSQAVVLDPINGRILAMAGLTDEKHSIEDLALPFVYLGAFSNGSSPGSLVWDVSLSGKGQIVENGPATIREALANGYFYAGLNVLSSLGVSQINAIENAIGLTLSGEVSPSQLASAYALLGGSGLRTGRMIQGKLQTTAILFAADEHGDVILDWSSPQGESVFDSQLAYLVTDVLQDGSARQSPLDFERPTALAPTASQHWRVAYSPQRVLAVWAAEPAQNFGQVFDALHEELPIRSWATPGGLRSVVVCNPSGELPSEDCPQTRREYFISGTEPRFVDSLFHRAAVNSLNGKLATVFTPQEFIEEKLFLNAPTFAQAWADGAGVLAPQEYDAVPLLLSDQITISQPAPFDELSGNVSIAADLGADIVGYDIQVGQGLRPTQWKQIASSDSVPATGELANWDTSGLSGLWAIQVQAWDSEGNVKRAYTIITIQEQQAGVILRPIAATFFFPSWPASQS